MARVCLLVLGMHRSGTSAITRVLSLMGATLPDRLMPAVANNNETGFWESKPLSLLHDAILAEVGSSWDDWRPIQFDRLSVERRSEFKAQMRDVLEEEFDDASLFVLKDPRICRLVPIYLELFAEMQIEPRFVLPLRNPGAVAKSLAARDDMSPGFASLLWLRYVLDAEAETRSARRVLVPYDELIDNWQPVVEGIGQALGIYWPRAIADVADDVGAFLRRDLRHHAGTVDLLADPAYPDWVRQAHAALGRLKDAPGDSAQTDVLDRVRSEFENAAPQLSNAMFDELRTRSRNLAQRAVGLAGSPLQSDLADLYNQFEDLKPTIVEAELIHLRELEALSASFVAARAEADATISTLQATLGEQQQRVAELEGRVLDMSAQNKALANELSKTAEKLDSGLRLRLQVERELFEAAQILEKERLEAAQAIASHDAEKNRLARLLDDQVAEAARLARDLESESASSRSLAETNAHLAHNLEAIYNSRSWTITKPVRAVTIGMRRIRDLPSTVASRVRSGSRPATLPAPDAGANLIDEQPSIAEEVAPAPTADTMRFGVVTTDQTSERPKDLIPEPPVFVPRIEAAPLFQKPVRTVAFYLPQFHPIPENDEWWGEGFTEWSNVRPAEPKFVGHHQPRIPGELGYYDLRDISVQRRQIELAKLYGLEGFCFYFYWFGGKRLLETPVENWLNDPTLDFPFCLCWANENWSRRWDGLDKEMLIGQHHSPEYDLAFIAEAARYLRDPRYIRVNGKPVLIIYRPSLLPSMKETAERWRGWCRDNGVGEIYLAYVQSFENNDPRDYGLDAALEFPPNNSGPPNVTDLVEPIQEPFASTVYDWSVLAERSETYRPRDYMLFRSVCPGWDNTARRKHGGTVFVNNTAARYQRWLENAIDDTVANIADPSERLVFVNAWNEWAEGAYL